MTWAYVRWVCLAQQRPRIVVQLPDSKKDYIRKQAHSRVCALATELLEATPDDPKGFLQNLLEKSGNVQVRRLLQHSNVENE